MAGTFKQKRRGSICIDGKTIRSNKRKEGKPSHIVSAWSREDGFCLGQRAVSEKSNDIRWLSQKKEWKGIKSIGMEEKTIKDEKGERKEWRYYISSLVPEIETFRRSVRGHWSVESMHWHLGRNIPGRCQYNAK